MIAAFILSICVLVFSGCQGLQVNMPVEVQTVKREEASLLIYVENKSSYRIKLNYPVTTDYLDKGQYTIFPAPKPGNYTVTVTAYTVDYRYKEIYTPIASAEIPIFMNGYDLVRTEGGFAGANLEIKDSMLIRK